MDDINTLKAFIVDKAKFCLHRPQGQLKYDYVTPSFEVIPGSDDQAEVPKRSSSGQYLQMYDWDACFFSQAASKLGRSDLPLSVVRNFLDLQAADGYIPRTVSPGRNWDGADHCKPFLAQTLNLVEDIAVLPDLLPSVALYLEFYRRRRHATLQLCAWRNVLESGVDDNLALLAPIEAAVGENAQPGNFPDGQVLAVDLNSYLIVECQAHLQLLSRLQSPINHQPLADWPNLLLEQMEHHLWNEQLGMYCNMHSSSQEQVVLRSWTGLLPAMLGIARDDRIEQIIERNILSPEHFWRPCGLASMAASEPLYNQAVRGLYGRVIVSNWQGPVWILPNVLAVRCLLKYGYVRPAKELARRVLSVMSEGLGLRATLFENYHAETGQPLWAANFMSWNILALELIDILG